MASTPNELTYVGPGHNDPPIPWPDPTPEMLETPEFEAVWQCIKRWDIKVPGAYSGYCGATGNHVRAILDALPRRRTAQEIRREIETFEQAYRQATDEYSRVAFAVRLCALQWVLFEPRQDPVWEDMGGLVDQQPEAPHWRYIPYPERRPGGPAFVDFWPPDPEEEEWRAWEARR